MAARRREHRARLETETKWSARQGVAATSRLGVGADGQLRRRQAPAGHRGDARRAAVRPHRARQRRASSRSRAAPAAARRPSGCTASRTSRSASRSASGPRRCSSSCRTRRSSTTWARVLPSLGVEGVPVTTFARFASRARRAALPAPADEGERRDAAGRVARQVAPGDAARHRPHRGAHRARRSTRACAPGSRSGPAPSRRWPRGRRRRRGRARRPDTRIAVFSRVARRQAADRGRAARVGPPAGHAQRARALGHGAAPADARASSGRGTSS